MKNTSSRRCIGGIMLAGLILPILVGAVMQSATPSLRPEDAARRLNDPDEKAALIDVRTRTEYNAFSLLRARSLPAGEISNSTKTAEVLKDAESVFLIGDTGFDGLGAVGALQTLGYRNVLNVAGGMDAWLAGTEALEKTVRTTRGEAPGVTGVSWPLPDQTAIVLAAFVLKPVYQTISFVIIILLWKRRERDFAAVTWAMVAFLLGENACAANYLFFREHSLLMEFLHMYGMLLCFGLVVYALMEAVDKRVLHFSDRERPCALLPQCGRCYKHGAARCNLRSLFILLIPAAMVLAAVPMTGSLAHRLFEGKIFGTVALFGQPLAYQYLETRIFPAVALVLLGTALIVLLRRGEEGFEASKRWLAAGMGPLGFSLMRFFLYWGYQDNPLWADFWEEGTEFLFIALLLWIALRARAVGPADTGGKGRERV